MYYTHHLFTLLLLLLLILFPTTSTIETDDSLAPDSSIPTTTHSSENEASTPVNSDVYNSRDLFTNPPNITQISNLIELSFYCEIDPTLCKKVQTAFISATNKFAAVINLKTKIIFQASYYSFCLNKCSNSTYGWGTPSSQFTLISLNEADSNFIYPQPLAKQLAQFTDSSNWANYDVAVDINHDIFVNNNNNGFWFNETNSTSIEDYQVDMEYVILHQIVHGLGMVSSWAPYFSDINSPFQQLLTGLIVQDDLRIMTPSPFWYVNENTGPTYITGFQPNMIFDKFLNLMISNQSINLIDYSFDMQNFCVNANQAFIFNFINSFLNNATQSSMAKLMYVSMSQENTLEFIFNSYVNQSVYFSNSYLNSTYNTMQLMTGPSIFTTSTQYYRPGISTSHVSDQYLNTPDFLMTNQFIHGQTLQSLIDIGYTNIPIINYNTSYTYHVNITTLVHNSTTNHTYNVTTEEECTQIVNNIYQSAIGPGILRILETIGYSTVLTNTNYSSTIIKTHKPVTICDDTNSNSLRTSSSSSQNSGDGSANDPISSTVSTATSLLPNYYYVFLALCLLLW